MVERHVAAVIVTLAFFLAGPLPASGQSRLGLVIGNDSYANVEPLKKAANDARAVAQSLTRIGFGVTLGLNLARRDFVRAIAEFESRLRPGDTAFVFYSGHGVEIEGANYLLPVDVPKVASGQQGVLRDEAVSTDALIQRLKARGTRAQILVLDACRDNPFRDNLGRSIGGARGLAAAQASSGVFIVYSAGIGESALDRLSDSDPHPNSVFTRSFLPLLESADKSMVEVAKTTRTRVKALAAEVGHQQSPAYYDEIDGDLFLARAGPPPTRPQASLPPTPQIPPQAIPQATPQPLPQVSSVPIAPAFVPQTAAPASGYMFADSDRRQLTRNELAGLSSDQLRIARNEIYARRGRFFRDPSLTAHFSRFSWYRPSTWDPPLNAVEKANVSLIQGLEHAGGGARDDLLRR
ncbi:MAG: caspase family protein [Proteobacteria bacterium]|nr:caspase family protein [Pseudomonadota bacterium]